MTKFIYSDFIPKEVDFFTVGKRYEVIETFSNHNLGLNYQVRVKDDNGIIRGPINIGKPCAYLDDADSQERKWSVEIKKDE